MGTRRSARELALNVLLPYDYLSRILGTRRSAHEQASNVSIPHEYRSRAHGSSRSAQELALNILIPCEYLERILFPVYKLSLTTGCCLLARDDIVIKLNPEAQWFE